MLHSVKSSLIGSQADPGIEERQAQLVNSIYMTVGNPGGWEQLLRDLVAATGSRSARMLVMNAEANVVTSSIKIHIDDNYHHQYVDYFVNKCPWRPELRWMTPGRLYSTYLHFSCPQNDFYNTEFYNDWARHQDIHHGLCGIVYRDASQTVQLLIQRTRDQGHYTEADAAFVNGLVPHMQHSFVIAGKVAITQARAEAIALAAERKSLPFLLLDKTLRLVYHSPDTKRLLNGSSVLAIKNSKLSVTDALLNSRLNKLFRQCLAAAETRKLQNGGGDLAVPQAKGADLKLLVRPIHPDIPLLVGNTGVYVAVYLYEPAAPVKIDPARLRSLYALSEAESRVAVAMVDTPDSIQSAEQCAISLNTLRTHLKAIFAKTQTRNRAELMKLLLTCPARLR